MHGLPEISGNVWENHKNIRAYSQIYDLRSLPLADYHRLPQQPIFKFGRKTTRPIIIKLTNAEVKRKIFGNLKNLNLIMNQEKCCT